MSCRVHGTLCAYPDESPDRCSYCHCDWVKIVAPAVAPAFGYGEMPLNHLWRHALDRVSLAERGTTRRRVA